MCVCGGGGGGGGGGGVGVIDLQESINHAVTWVRTGG